MSEFGLRANYVPDDESRDRRKDDARNKKGSDAIREALDRRTGPLRLADHPHNLRKKRVRTDAFRAHKKSARSVDGSARDFGGHILFNGDRFATDHRFIDGAMALKNEAIDGNLFTRSDTQTVTHLNLIEKHVRLVAFRIQSSRRPWGKP